MADNLLARLRNTDDILLHYFPLHSALADWGKDLESHLSEWIVTHPEAYQDALAKSYEAGCDFGSTSTQAASPWRANAFGLRGKVHEHNYLSAKLGKEVTPDDCYLAGFVSSTNPDFLEPLGSLTRADLYEGYREQISALLEGGVDLIMVVGNDLDAKLEAVKAAKALDDVPVVAQNVYFAGLRGYRTMMGFDVATATTRALEAGADVVGASCGLMKRAEDDNPQGYFECATSLVAETRACCDAVLSMQPNAGMAQLVDGETVHPATPDELAEQAPNWIAAGARIVGGCCGTSLEHYRKLAANLRG